MKWSTVLRNTSWLSLLGLFFFFSPHICANQFTDAISAMYQAKIDPSTARSVSNLTITHKNVSFHMQNGTFAFYPPITIDGKQHYWGGCFFGSGQFDFAPPIKIERDQLQRFFKQDSLSGTFGAAGFFFSDSIYNLIMTNSSPAAATALTDEQIKWGENSRHDLTESENYEYLFAAIKDIVEPNRRPLLVASLSPKDIGHIWYLFLPAQREEVQLYKEYREVVRNYMELVCQYSQFVDSTYRNLNGAAKVSINEQHYDAEATIKRDGQVIAKTRQTSYVLRTGLRALDLDLHYDLTVDSIISSTGKQVAFWRHKDRDNRNYPLYVFLDEPANEGDNLELTYYYSGKIAESYIDVFYVTASIMWIPRTEDPDGATYHMTFHFPKGMEFVAAGKEIKRSESSGEITSEWDIPEPTSNVSFSVGFIKKYQFKDDQIGTVDVYYDRDVSMDIARFLALSGQGVGSDMQNVVADDIINSARLFSYRFGSRQSDHLAVSESFATHGEAFANFMHLGASTWINTDDKEYDKAVRAHEVAHQWWGLGVDNESYHDKWLSEGFAEYSSLMYLQTVLGNKVFLDQLGKYRDRIFSNRKFLFGDAPQAGPIVLGYRTSNSHSEASAYALIIYEKGAYILHMLRNLFLDLNTMNEDAFFDMMKEWYSTYRGRQATTADFKQLTEKYTGIDMSWFFNQWVYGTELPTYTFSYTIAPDTNKTYKAVCTVLSEGVSDTFVADVPIQVQYDDQHSMFTREAIHGAKTEFTIPGLTKEPKKLIFNVFESILAQVKQ